MDLKAEITRLCTLHQMTFKELAEKAGFNASGLHDKFRRDSMTIRDYERLLSVFGKRLSISDK